MTLDHLVRAPGVFQTDEDLVVEEDFWPAVSKALRKALAQMLKMRQREGAHLAQDLVRRIGIMRKAVNHIQKHAPQVSARYRQQLIERIKSAGLTRAGTGGRPVAEGGRLFCGPLGHFGGTDPAAKPFQAI